MADDVAEQGCCGKISNLWATNKPLAIFLLILITLINLGVIFLLLWFFVINKNQAAQSESTSSVSASASTPTAAATTAATAAHTAFLHLRAALSQ